MDGTLMIARAGVGDVEDLLPLFGAYREFYRRGREVEKERVFLRERLERAEAEILVARLGGDGVVRGLAVGFTLLYPTFASVSLRSAWILNDLYVEAEFRRAGVGRALMEAAARFARATGAARLELRTQHTNTSAQRLYEGLGWKMDEQFRRYTLAL